MPKYTEEQIERAKNVDVRTFLEQVEGYTFQQIGRYLKCQNPEKTNQPSSLTVDTHSNLIFYNSVTGNKPLSAIDWCREIKDMDFPSSLKLILGEDPQGQRAERPKYQQYRPRPQAEYQKKDFELPERSERTANVYAYLTKERGIAANIVNDCIKNGTIYQDTRRNAVFVGKDDDGQPKYAARRGTWTFAREPFKRDAVGSDKKFAFKLVGKNTDTIYVAEAAIDALSLATLEDKFHGQGAYKEKTFLSAGGAGIDKAIEQFCKTHAVNTINVCYDNDKAGEKGFESIKEKFEAQGCEVNDMRASYAHDYNDELKAFNQDPSFYPAPPAPIRLTTAKENLIASIGDLHSDEKQYIHFSIRAEDGQKLEGIYRLLADEQGPENTIVGIEGIEQHPEMTKIWDSIRDRLAEMTGFETIKQVEASKEQQQADHNHTQLQSAPNTKQDATEEYSAQEIEYPEPIVKIIHSELDHPMLSDGNQLTFSVANELFDSLNTKRAMDVYLSNSSVDPLIYKVNYMLTYQSLGKVISVRDSFNIGAEDSDLLEHIHNSSRYDVPGVWGNIKEHLMVKEKQAGIPLNVKNLKARRDDTEKHKEVSDPQLDKDSIYQAVEEYVEETQVTEEAMVMEA